MTTEDAARILGVSPETPLDEVKDAYRRLARFYHPDHQTSADLKPLAESKLKEVNLAFDLFKKRESQGTPKPSPQSSSAHTATESYRWENSTADEDIPAFDLDAFWREVTNVRVPTFQYTRPIASRSAFSPTPIPQTAVPGPKPPMEKSVLQKSVGGIAVVSIVLALPTSTRLFGINLAAVFSIWWCICEWLALSEYEITNKDWVRAWNELKAEHSRRERIRQERLEQLRSVEKRNRDSFGAIVTEFRTCLERLRTLKSHLTALNEEFDLQVEVIVREEFNQQLDAFLALHCIRDFKIPGIGSARLNQLEVFGIFTAADIDVEVLCEIPGFGESLILALLEFRRIVISRFQYKPSSVWPKMTSELRSILDAQDRCQFQLHDGLLQLREISQRGETQLSFLVTNELLDLVNCLAQADVDLADTQRSLGETSNWTIFSLERLFGIKRLPQLVLIVCSLVAFAVFIGSQFRGRVAPTAKGNTKHPRPESANPGQTPNSIASSGTPTNGGGQLSTKSEEARQTPPTGGSEARREESNQNVIAAELRLQRARLLLNQGESGQAKSALHELISEFAASEQATDARRLLDELSKQEKLAQSKLSIAKLVAQTNKPAAIKWLNELIEAYPATEAAEAGKAILKKLTHPTEPTKSPESKPESTKDPLAQARIHRERGVKAFNDKSYVQAVREFSRALDLDNSELSYDHRALANFYARNFEHAAADCSKVIELNPRHAAAFYLRSLCHLKLRKTADAKADLTSATELDAEIAKKHPSWVKQ